MSLDDQEANYLLGRSDAEHERLIRQAKWLNPVTETFLREAGVGLGQRVLELGSGVGDVAMLLSRLVGPSGEVVAIERDARSINRAKARVIDAGLHNVAFVHADIARFSSATSFDALVGRYVLQFSPDPVGVLRSLYKYVRSGGIVAFQEVSWAPFAALSANLPLWSASVSLLREISVLVGVNIEMGPALHRVFQDAGLPVPKIRVAMELGDDPEFTRLLPDAIASVYPHIEKHGLKFNDVGDLSSLRQRLHEEVASANVVVPWLPLVGAWCRKPVETKNRMPAKPRAS